MTSLSGALSFDRAMVFEVVEDPNTVPRYVIAGSVGSVSQNSAMMGKADTTTLDGSFRTYGNGNTRLILGSGASRTVTFAFRALTDDQLAVLDALRGHTVVYCDTYGRRVIGAYIGTTEISIPLSGGLTDVNIVIQQVTYDEEV